MSFKIEKAKYLTDGKVTVELIKKDDKGDEFSASESHDAPAHADLRAAYDAMGVHLALLCGYAKTNKIKDIEKVNPYDYQDFHVTGFTYTGTKDDPKIVLTGYYQHEIATTILNTKALRIEAEGEDSYIFMGDFEDKLDRVEKELRAYLDGSKRGKNPQGNLFDNQPQAGRQGEASTKVQILPEDKPFFQQVRENAGFKDEKELMQTPEGSRLKTADPDAMARVQAWDNEGKEIAVDEGARTPTNGKVATPKKGNQKRVAQSSENPGGIVEEPKNN